MFVTYKHSSSEMRFFCGRYHRHDFILESSSRARARVAAKGRGIKAEYRVKKILMLYGLGILWRWHVLACAVPKSPHKLMLSRGIIPG